MTANKKTTPEIQKDFQQQLARLWPVLKGSLSEIHKPCIRPNCSACARGDKHAAFILSFTQDGRRRCMYVPAELVPLLRQGLENGRILEALLSELGPRLLRYYREQRGPKPKT
jgi:hypothetical protein